MLGYEAEEMVGRHVFTFMDEQAVDLCNRELQRRREGIEEDFEISDGVVVPVEGIIMTLIQL